MKTEREKRLEAALRGLLSRDDFWQAATRAGIVLPGELDDCADILAHEDAGGGEVYERCNCAHPPPQCRDPACHLIGNTPPQQRDALEALEKYSEFAEAEAGRWSEAMVHSVEALYEQIKAALTAPPTVPEAVRRLPSELRNECCGDAGMQRCADELDRALAQSGEGRVPEGWKLVPVKPTTKMIEAGSDASGDWLECTRDSYRAMLAAAPEPDGEERVQGQISDETHWSNTAAVLQERLTRTEDEALRRGSMLKSPCFICGYNGPGYFQPSTHPCAERHHRLFRLVGPEPDEREW